MTDRGMTDDDRRLLDVAAKWWTSPGAHAEAARVEFGISVTRYWQRVNGLVEDPEALAYSPVVVNRLRRLCGDDHTRGQDPFMKKKTMVAGTVAALGIALSACGGGDEPAPSQTPQANTEAAAVCDQYCDSINAIKNLRCEPVQVTYSNCVTTIGSARNVSRRVAAATHGDISTQAVAAEAAAGQFITHCGASDVVEKTRTCMDLADEATTEFRSMASALR